MKAKFGLKPIVRIKDILRQKKLTQKELAELLDETPQQINKWVNGVEPCLSSMGRIALTLGVTLGDLVWHKGDNADFDENNYVYIRGEIIDGLKSDGPQYISAATGNADKEKEILTTLQQYYRWTDEERNGVKLVRWNALKGEAILGCVSKEKSQAFINWAKRDRDYMYRL